MKHIFLAKRLKRIIAACLDAILLTFVSGLVYFLAVFPNAFDVKAFETNQTKIIELYKDSELFVCTDTGSFAAKSVFEYENKVENLYDIDLTHNGAKFEDNCLTKDLYIFYTTLYMNYGGQNNLNLDSYCSQILKLNTQTSNIKSFDPVTYKFTLLDETKQSVTVNYFLNCYSSAATFVQNSMVVNNYVNANQKLLLDTLFLFIPIALGVSFITHCLIPMVMPHGQTLGKLIFGYGVLDQFGYTLKKGWYIPRWLVFGIFEYSLTIITFGGTFLISFIMFQFAKKRRCLHDKLSNSVVVDLKESIYFDSPQEEEIYKKYKEKYKDE